MSSIVVVDDEQAVRELFGLWLEMAGHDVWLAGSAGEAKAHLHDTSVDVMLTDISMAHTTGIDLLTWSREHDPDMPVVLVTGKPGVDTAVEALRLGAYDYLVKPVGEPALAHVIGRAVTHRQLLHERQELARRNQRYQERLEEQVAERTAALERRNQQLLLLQQVADTITALDDLAALFERLVATVHDTFGYADVAIFLVDAEGKVVRLQAVAGEFSGSWQNGYRQAWHEGLIGRALGGEAYIVASDVRDWPEYKSVPGRVVLSEALFPIRVEGDVVALLLVAEKSADAFDDTDVIVMRTLTEHLSVAIDNANLYAQLHDALEARDVMLANVSHELRSPLAVITAWAEMLCDQALGPMSEDSRHASGNILSSAQHLSHLVNLLLTFQRLDREEMVFSPIRVRSWLEESDSAWQPIFERCGVTLVLDVEPDVGFVDGNLGYLQQVVNNLLDNVRKFSPTGGQALLRAWRVGDEVRVALSDEGVGVPPDKLPRLFQRFYQVDAGETRRFGGMGLGLSVSEEIIRRHGGRIWAESAGENQGTTVTFTLPVAGDDPAGP